MDDSTIVLLASIISITIMQVVACIHLHLDGIVLSASTGAVITIALKRVELTKRLRGLYNGRNEFLLRTRGRSDTPTS